MIVRIWRGRTSAPKADDYEQFLKTTAHPDYGSVRGNRGWLLGGGRPLRHGRLPGKVVAPKGEEAMLTATPKKWFSWDFTVTEGDRAIADIDISWWREQGVLTVQGVGYRVYREGMMRGDFILEAAGSVVARAQKPSAFRRSFIVGHEGKRFTLRAKSAGRQTFLLLDGEREIGSLSPEGIFTRRAVVDLPPTLPLPMKVFIIWLAVILWKRESEAAGA